MFKSLLATLLVGSTFGAASAHAVTLTVVNDAHVPHLAKIETAVAMQSHQLAAWWHTPTVTFGPGGWKVYVERHVATEHGVDAGEPYAVVGTGTGLSVSFSHEVLEMLVNPQLTLTLNNYNGEVCDPVEDATYTLHGVRVSDFVTPWWFAANPPAGAVYDQLHRASNQRVLLGGYDVRWNT